MKKVAILSIQGVPAQYGGFESLVENLIGEYKSKDIQYTVFCSSKDMPEKLETYKGAILKYIPFHANGIQSVLYDSISMLRVMRGYDVILILGVSVPVLWIYKKLCKGKLIINDDGLSQFRAKYNSLTKAYIAFLKGNVVRYADELVSDNQGVKDFFIKKYNKDSHLIAYGGDHVLRNIERSKQEDLLKKYNIQAGNYSVTVCRIEPENNCHIILDSFSKSSETIVFVGNWQRSEYGRNLVEQYKSYKNLILLDPIYDLDTLFVLRNNAKYYIHGHSVGGTNPSLVEAMFFGKTILAYNVVYNRETTFNNAYYFSDSNELQNLLKNEIEDKGAILKENAFEHYTWKHITECYEALY